MENKLRIRREHAYKISSEAGIGLTRPEASALVANGILDDQLREELLSGARPAEEVLSDPERNTRIERIIDSPSYVSAKVKIGKFVGLVKQE